MIGVFMIIIAASKLRPLFYRSTRPPPEVLGIYDCCPGAASIDDTDGHCGELGLHPLDVFLAMIHPHLLLCCDLR